MAGNHRPDQGVPELDKGGRRIEPSWPDVTDGDHPVSEFLATSQGALSPFGEDTTFPLPLSQLSYEHPTGLPNRAGE